MSDIRELEDKIRKLFPHLQNIEVGQIFHSKHYGNITATQITSHSKGIYSIYGFDEDKGLPRDCYYPRDLKLIGKPIMLTNVLEYYKMCNYEEGVNMMFEHEWINGCNYIIANWDLYSPFLANQSKELIRFLNNINYD